MFAQLATIAQQDPATPLRAHQERSPGTRKTYKRAIASCVQLDFYAANPASRFHMKSARRDTFALAVNEKRRSYVRKAMSVQRDLPNQPCAWLVHSATRKGSRNVNCVPNGTTVTLAVSRQLRARLAIIARFKHRQRRHTHALQAHLATRLHWQDPMSVRRVLQENSAMDNIRPIHLQGNAVPDTTVSAAPRQRHRSTTLQADCAQVASCASMERGFQRQ